MRDPGNEVEQTAVRGSTGSGRPPVTGFYWNPCWAFNTDPPRLEADRRSKSKQSPGNSSEIDAILDWAAKWLMPLPVTQVVIDMLRSDELYCPSTNQVLPLLEQLTPWTLDRVKQLQSPYFSALSPHAINPTAPTQGHIVLSPVSLASRDQDDGPVELNDRHLRSHGKIGDCEQSNLLIKVKRRQTIS